MAAADRRRGRRRSLVAILPLAAVLLAGCGGSGDPDRTSAASKAASGAEEADASPTGLGTVQSVDCPAAARAVDLPQGFPAPLPKDTVVVDVRGPVGGRTVVTGVVPHAEKDVLADLQQAYKGNGFSLTEGETEARDAESNFTGSGVQGRWGIRELTECSPVATRIDVVVAQR